MTDEELIRQFKTAIGPDWYIYTYETPDMGNDFEYRIAVRHRTRPLPFKELVGKDSSLARCLGDLTVRILAYSAPAANLFGLGSSATTSDMATIYPGHKQPTVAEWNDLVSRLRSDPGKLRAEKASSQFDRIKKELERFMRKA
jgi:hypothetical protein